MADISENLLSQIAQITASHACGLYGFADIQGLAPQPLAAYPCAISFVFQMEPWVMAQLGQGPTDAYSVLYGQVNLRIDALAAELARALERAGYRAWPVHSSERTDKVNIRGDFPHKTAATRAGLGWIGKHCQLITKKWGPWVRLGTVLSDAPLPTAEPVHKSRCGKCHKCVEACPAGALKGAAWSAGLERAAILDAWACDQYKKTHFAFFHGGHNCGICTNACPVGQKTLK